MNKKKLPFTIRCGKCASAIARCVCRAPQQAGGAPRYESAPQPTPVKIPLCIRCARPLRFRALNKWLPRGSAPREKACFGGADCYTVATYNSLTARGWVAVAEISARQLIMRLPEVPSELVAGQREALHKRPDVKSGTSRFFCELWVPPWVVPLARIGIRESREYAIAEKEGLPIPQPRYSFATRKRFLLRAVHDTEFRMACSAVVAIDQLDAFLEAQGYRPQTRTGRLSRKKAKTLGPATRGEALQMHYAKATP